MRSLYARALAFCFAALVHLPGYAQQTAPQQTAPEQTAPLSADSAQETDTSLSRSPADSRGDTPAHAPGESLARIIRLSQKTGAVQMDRNTGAGFEPAMPNMPLVQGVRLRTQEGLAEVEFEDNSSLRLTPDTEVDFPELKLRQTGEKVSVLRIERGSVYVSTSATRDNGLRVEFSGHRLTLGPSAHVHLFVGDPQTRLSVLGGTAQVTGPDGVVVAAKKQTITFDPAGAGAPQVAKGVVHDTYDDWDKTGVEYQKRYALSNSFGASPYGYGLADLNYYGALVNAGGCGQIWQPYLTGAGWSPYTAGAWAWYPGAGYSFVSLYPWGWTPFHSGEWAYCQGSGWGWRPTGGWNGINNLQRLHITGNVGGTPVKPPTPPPPPRPRQPTIISATPRQGAPLAVSGMQPSGEFTFRNDSAGLGVPRGAFSHLNKISAGVQQRGAVTTIPSWHAMNSLHVVGSTAAAARAGAPGQSGPTTGHHTPVASAPSSHATTMSAPSSSSSHASTSAVSSHK